jgi:hypothetical protein
MTVQVGWDKGEWTIIRVRFEGEWVWDDLASGLEEVDALLISVDHRVDLIIDATGSQMIPNDLLQHIREIATPAGRENEGAKVVVGANGVVRAGYGLFRRMYGRQIKDRGLLFAGTLEEAYEIIAEARADSRQRHEGEEL